MPQPHGRPDPNRPVPLYTVRSDTRVIRRGMRVAIVGVDHTAAHLVFLVVGEHDLQRPDRTAWDVFPIRASNLVAVEARAAAF